MFKPSYVKSKKHWHEVLAQARARTDEVRALDPAWGLAIAISAQLDQIETAVANGRSPTEQEKERLSLGVLAMRNLDDSDPGYSKLLKALDYAFWHWDELPDA
jgi:hypothetical protein